MIIKTDVFCGSRMRTARVFLGIEMDDLFNMTKTDREIELEKKLEIARKNLKEIGDAVGLYFRREHTKDFAEDILMGIGIVVGQTQQALKEIR